MNLATRVAGTDLPYESEHERHVRRRMTALLTGTPIPRDELLDNLPLYLRSKTLSSLLATDVLYRMILDVPGVILELGVYRGQHLANLTALRSVHEPHNPYRRIIGFDTFTGFPDVTPIDESGSSASPGQFDVGSGYSEHVRAVLQTHEDGDHLGHIQRTVVVQGDTRETLPAYLERNPQTVVALAYFDLDLYEPTRDALNAIEPYLTRGSVLAFDELNHAKWPGETAAVRDTIGLEAGELRLIDRHPGPAYMRWGT